MTISIRFNGEVAELLKKLAEEADTSPTTYLKRFIKEQSK